MGFCRLTCPVCEGKAYTLQPSPTPGFPLYEVLCTNCEGEGTIITHTGAIGSMVIGIDRGRDQDWATLWEKLDDGTIHVLDSSGVPRRNQ